MSDRVEVFREFDDAAMRWGELNIEFATASERLAAVIAVVANHTSCDRPETEELRAFAEHLVERARNAQVDALDVGEMAARIRDRLADDET